MTAIRPAAADHLMSAAAFAVTCKGALDVVTVGGLEYVGVSGFGVYAGGACGTTEMVG